MAVSTAHRGLLRHLVDRAVRGAALGRAQRRRVETACRAADPGAPAVPHLAAKLVWTTLVATVVFAGGNAYVYVNALITLDDLARWLGMPQ